MKISNKAILDSVPSCVLLDLDNTLYPYAPSHAAGMQAAAAYAARELNLSRTDFERCYADARTELKRRLAPSAASHHRLLYFQRAIEKAGLASQPAAALQIEQAYWSAYLGAADLFPQVPEFLDDLRIAGIPTVIVTDLTAQIQHRKMLYFGLDRYIDWIVTSEEAGADKPDPAIFQLALAKLGGVEGAIWMIGDSPKRDIAGAKAALGCFTILMSGQGASESDTTSQADICVDSFAELRSLLQRVAREDS